MSFFGTPLGCNFFKITKPHQLQLELLSESEGEVIYYKSHHIFHSSISILTMINPDGNNIKIKTDVTWD